jgi:2-C-methyl-D-erythritol 4-phosphate cytidylyltransferase
MQVAAVVPAAGCGTRFGGAVPKQYLCLAGLPLLAWTLRAVRESNVVSTLTVVVAPGEEARCRAEVLVPCGIRADVIPGGADRQASVFAGLSGLPDDPDLVLVHDGARPLITPDLIRAAVETAARDGAAVVAVPVSDTIKVAGDDRTVLETPARGRLWAAQTPQVFRADWLRAAHRKALADGFRGTDDSVLVERLGYPVRLVPGTPSNLKVTTPTDLAQAEHVLRARLAEAVP